MEINTAGKKFLKAYSVYMKAPVQIISSLVQRKRNAYFSTLKPEDIECIRATVENMEQKLKNLRFSLR